MPIQKGLSLKIKRLSLIDKSLSDLPFERTLKLSLMMGWPVSSLCVRIALETGEATGLLVLGEIPRC